MVAADDEQAWICRARDGDAEAYGVLVERYQQRIFRLVAKWLGPDHAGIEDVTQDVFVRAYTALDTFRGDASFSTWLTRIALNRCRDEHRRTMSRRALQEAFAREDVRRILKATRAELGILRRNMRQEVHAILASSERRMTEVLEPDQRDAFRTLMAEHRAHRHHWFRRRHWGKSPPPPSPQNE